VKARCFGFGSLATNFGGYLIDHPLPIKVFISAP
jgi:hypothetical protein